MLTEAHILPGKTGLSPWKKEFNLRAPCPCPARRPGSWRANEALAQLASQVCSTWHEIWEQLAALIPPPKKNQKEKTSSCNWRLWDGFSPKGGSEGKGGTSKVTSESTG